MGSIVGKLLLQVVLIGLNAFFAATEIAVVSLNATKLKKMEEEGDKRAKRLLKMVESPSSFLSTIQIAITLAGLLGSAFAADSFAGYIVDGVYNGLGLTMIPAGVMNTIAMIITTLVLSYFQLVFGELVPKRIAMQKSFQVACFTSRVVVAVATVMRPVIWLLSVSTNGMLKLLRLKVEAEEETVTEEEIRMMIDLGGQKGTIDQEEQEWIENVFRFDDISVREAMTRTADVVAFSLDATAEEIIHTIRETGLSRYPVYDEDINDIVGTLNARDFLLERGAEHPRSLKELLRTPYFVPESIHADDLFRDMQTKKIHIAIVIDEYGQTAGIITIEDLLEEIVGNIYDEFDPAESPEMEKLGDNLWRVTGSVFIDELAEALDMEIPEDEDYDTVGGMIFSCLHTIPADGSQFDVQVNGLDIHVEKIEDRRIEEALIKKLPPEEPEEDGDEEQDRKDQNRKEQNKKEKSA
ncbi:MAG TPA: hemolysin family protein [Candidatus Eisenbergiella stercorigallinarum]|uniref:Hemolysin family protein n=2 Tax=Eisenbergiella TaxID=1432051 RepID=A0A9D2R0G1_9FIRM|nr:hemolysin family protein [Candidatus Eisenbergiella stercorigallinarum]